ncbi:class I adenylate-forming enzyme family protein [Sulfitobacter sp. MOLA879]|uniref:class I adenylate-forming enzyme family protein n=1 Tax=Sulfitobacter sp. MOLA879 TaxID=3368579 RepID=UPI0037477A9B
MRLFPALSPGCLAHCLTDGFLEPRERNIRMTSSEGTLRPEAHMSPAFLSLPERVANFARSQSKDIALSDDTRQVTWSALDIAGNRIAQVLTAQGVGVGDTVAMLVGSKARSVELMLGIWRCGATIAPLSSLLRAETLAAMLKDCRSPFLIVDPELEELGAEAARIAGRALLPAQNITEAAGAQDAQPIARGCEPEDMSTLIYSSGTTGLPKGILHTHAARCDFCAMMALSFRMTPRSRVLSTTPIYSNGTFMMLGAALYVGAQTHLMSKFDAAAFLRVAQEYEPTHGFVVPTMCQALRAHTQGSQPDLRSFEVALTAGAPMPADLKEWMMHATGNGLGELWGLTEGVATYLPPEDMKNDPVSVGRPMIGMDVRIIDDTGTDVTGSGLEGEIVGRSGCLCSRYLNRPDETRALQWKDRDGRLFLRSGDIGVFDDHGALHLRGRKKDMLISGGLNVYPVDIERVLLAHPSVTDCAVTGQSDPHWGERPVAYVQTDATDPLDPETIRDWVNARLEKHQQIVRIVMCFEDFPRNALGKVVKAKLFDTHISEKAKA